MNDNGTMPVPPRLLIAGFVLSLVGSTLILSGVSAMGSLEIAAPSSGARLGQVLSERGPFAPAPREFLEPQNAMDKASVLQSPSNERTICASQSLRAEIDLAWAACQAASRMSVSSAASSAHVSRFDLRQELTQMATVHFAL